MVKRAGGALMYSVKVDPQSNRPLAAQIANSIRDLILAGGIRAGARLPATRTLADELGVSRTTMVEVFERLTAEGLVESRVGAGTFVKRLPGAAGDPRSGLSEAGERRDRPAGTSTAQRPPEAAASFGPPKPSLPPFARRLAQPTRAFAPGLPALDVFPVARWSRLVTKHLRDARATTLGYSHNTGFRPLRRMIASHLRATRGIVCDERQVFIVNGAQQAFHILGSMLLEPGDKVWFANPGSIGARNALLAARAQLVPVPVDREGMVVAQGHNRAPEFRMAFVTPTHQQPLGVTMSLARRFQLLAAAEAVDAWIVENDGDGDFHYDSQPLPAIKTADRANRVLYVGTFSKTLFPSLRLGYVVAPEPLVDTLTEVFNAYLPGTSFSLQATVAAFMEEGHFATHIRRMRRIYQERRDALMDAVQRHCGELLTLQQVESGLHTIGHLPLDLPEAQVARTADASGVAVIPISRYCLEPASFNGLVLGFGGYGLREIESGAKTLGRVLEDLYKRQIPSMAERSATSTSV